MGACRVTGRGFRPLREVNLRTTPARFRGRGSRSLREERDYLLCGFEQERRYAKVSLHENSSCCARGEVSLKHVTLRSEPVPDAYVQPICSPGRRIMPSIFLQRPPDSLAPGRYTRCVRPQALCRARSRMET